MNKKKQAKCVVFVILVKIEKDSVLLLLPGLTVSLLCFQIVYFE